MQRLMQDHGKEDASPRDEFKALLASGSLSPAMHQFLTSTLCDCTCSPLTPMLMIMFGMRSDMDTHVTVRGVQYQHFLLFRFLD